MPLQIIRRTILFTGAQLFLGLGGVPRKVVLTNIQSASDNNMLIWTPENAALAGGKGGALFQGTGATSFASKVYTPATGIAPYEGEDRMLAAGSITTTAGRAYQVPVELCIETNNPVSGATTLAGDLKQRAAPVTKFIIDDSATFKGHFDAAIDTTLVGVGSEVIIKNAQTLREQRHFITAITGNGTAASAVTLDRTPIAGLVQRISYKYGMGALPSGLIMPKGIVINEATDVNVADEIGIIEAEIEI